MSSEAPRPPKLEKAYQDLKKQDLPYEKLLLMAATMQIQIADLEKLVENYAEICVDNRSLLKKMYHLMNRLGEIREESGIEKGLTKGKALARKETAKKAAKAKLERDPKQAAKSKARELWNDWQAGRTLHKGQAAFARYVVQCLPVIESTESVNRWVREWRAEAGK